MLNVILYWIFSFVAILRTLSFFEGMLRNYNLIWSQSRAWKGQTFSFEESKFGLIEVQEEEEEMDSDAAKPFECELCKKQFTKIEILKRHIKTHLKDKVCVCGLQSLIATCFVYFCRNSNAHTVPKPSTEETFLTITYETTPERSPSSAQFVIKSSPAGLSCWDTWGLMARGHSSATSA